MRIREHLKDQKTRRSLGLFSATAVSGVLIGVCLAIALPEMAFTTGSPTRTIPLTPGMKITLPTSDYLKKPLRTSHSLTVILEPPCHTCSIKQINWAKIVQMHREPVVVVSSTPSDTQEAVKGYQNFSIVSLDQVSSQLIELQGFAPLKLNLNIRGELVHYEFLPVEISL
jgi:hypothetical protein